MRHTHSMQAHHARIFCSCSIEATAWICIYSGMRTLAVCDTNIACGRIIQKFPCRKISVAAAAAQKPRLGAGRGSTLTPDQHYEDATYTDISV